MYILGLIIMLVLEQLIFLSFFSPNKNEYVSIWAKLFPYPQKVHVEVLTPSTQNVTVFVDRACNKISHKGPNPIRLDKKRKFGHRKAEERGCEDTVRR